MEMENETITIKQRLCVSLILFAVQILKPFKYDHEYKTLVEEIKKIIHNK